MMHVIDASTVVAALVDGGPAGRWAESFLDGPALAAPCLLPAEVANVLRKAAQSGQISTEVASLAHIDLLDLNIEYFPYSLFGLRVWELRNNVTTYDAWYVALAESLDAELVTLDSRLVRSAGPRCRFIAPS